MAAKGTIAKASLIPYLTELLKGHGEVTDVFSPDGKELRVDFIENGAPVQIKIALTAVKSPISNSPETQVINEEQFFISDVEKEDLTETLKEMGVKF